MSFPAHLEGGAEWLVGFHDSELAGWCDAATGEVAPGFPVTAGDIVVDVGCGEGGLAKFCGRMGARVIVSDVDADKVARAVAELGGTGAAVEGIVGDGARLPLPDAQATRVLCTEVLEHVDDPAIVMAELVRIAAPGALLLITVPHHLEQAVQRKLAPPDYFQRPNHIRVFGPGMLDALVERAGLAIEHRSADGFFWSIYMALRWQSGGRIGGDHPTLRRWSKTWVRVLQGPDGPKIKRALDAVLPMRQVVVARKPGTPA